jgi:hypothetical protein
MFSSSYVLDQKSTPPTDEQCYKGLRVLTQEYIKRDVCVTSERITIVNFLLSWKFL